MIIRKKKQRIKLWVDKKPNWTTWFAWYPIYLDEEEYWVWFEKIERKRAIFYRHSTYQDIVYGTKSWIKGYYHQSII